VVPGTLRRCYWLFALVVCAGGCWTWFGTSGAALILLWAEARRPWRTATFRVPLDPHRSAPLAMDPWRVSMRIDGRSQEIFRDEVCAAEWALLRSFALEARQLAAGWRTSRGSP
jgi:hypothetical protein